MPTRPLDPAYKRASAEAKAFLRNVTGFAGAYTGPSSRSGRVSAVVAAHFHEPARGVDSSTSASSSRLQTIAGFRLIDRAPPRTAVGATRRPLCF